VVFGEVIGKVVGAFAPVHIILTLLHSTFNPIESHVHSLPLSLFDGVVDYAGCAFLVGLKWSGGLQVPHFSQYNMEWTCILGIIEARP
jgi:hypothetical protein